MVQAWYHDDVEGEKNNPHQTTPPQFVSLEKLFTIGVQYWKIESEQQLEEVTKEEGYIYNEEITLSSDKLPNYEQMMQKFYEEHVHPDDETRLTLDGSGYFDVRDLTNNNKWIRIHVFAGDMISIPAGLCHRFTIEENNYSRLKRFFKEVPNWIAFNRADGEHPATVEYLKKYS